MADLKEKDFHWLFLYLVRRVDLDSVITKQVETQGYWVIDQLRSPVVEFIRSNCKDNAVTRGRLYYNDAYYDDAGQPCGKSPGFTDWAKKVLSKARRMLTYDKASYAYIGDEAIEMRKNGVVLRSL